MFETTNQKLSVQRFILSSRAEIHKRQGARDHVEWRPCAEDTSARRIPRVPGSDRNTVYEQCIDFICLVVEPYPSEKWWSSSLGMITSGKLT